MPNKSHVRNKNMISCFPNDCVIDCVNYFFSLETIRKVQGEKIRVLLRKELRRVRS